MEVMLCVCFYYSSGHDVTVGFTLDFLTSQYKQPVEI